MNPIIQNEIQEYLRVKKEMKDLGKNIELYSKEEEMLEHIEIKNSDNFKRQRKLIAFNTFITFGTIANSSFIIIPWSIDVITRIVISIILGAVLAWVFNFVTKNRIKMVMYRYIELMEEFSQDYQNQKEKNQ
ncbi:hypothetical protein [Capnocytophaga sputigena]|uniref:hypothetical protein n=1 Tax=Capnocytophaga sputigena TaxID=1019 RepID=UPI003C751D82